MPYAVVRVMNQLMMMYLSLLVVIINIVGVQCQSFTVPSETCPGERVSFTCVTNSGATNWRVTPPGDDGVCSYSGATPEIDFCGPGDRFTSSPIDDGDPRSSSLSVVLTDDINGTMVQCQEAVVDGAIIGSSSICVSDSVSVPSIIFTEFIEASSESCRLSIEWKEATVSCSGFPQYQLSLTPPTSDCLSSSEEMCQLNTERTGFNLTLTVDQMYNITLRAVACNNTLLGPNTDPIIISTESITVESCEVHYKYSPFNRSLTAVDITWTPVTLQDGSTIQPEVEYTVVIEDGLGTKVRERVGTEDCDSTHCSHTYYPELGTREEFGVLVETTGCVTKQTVCQETPVYCPLSELSVSLVDEVVEGVCGRVSGGGVCYSGEGVGSVAVFFCDDGYSLEGHSTRECLSTGLWNGSSPQCVRTTREECKREECPVDGTTAAVTGVVCSVVFLSVGVLLGVMGLYLVLRMRRKISNSSPSSPLPPPANYEEVGGVREVKSSQDIQLTSNEAYGPVQRNTVET